MKTDWKHVFAFDGKELMSSWPRLSKAGIVETLAFGGRSNMACAGPTSRPTWKSGASERTLDVSFGLSFSYATRSPSACEIGARTIWGAVKISKSQRSLEFVLFHVERRDIGGKHAFAAV